MTEKLCQIRFKRRGEAEESESSFVCFQGEKKRQICSSRKNSINCWNSEAENFPWTETKNENFLPFQVRKRMFISIKIFCGHKM